MPKTVTMIGLTKEVVTKKGEADPEADPENEVVTEPGRPARKNEGSAR
jgi:hypothetical protein